MHIFILCSSGKNKKRTENSVLFYFSRFSNAERTAAMTKAEKVQSFPVIVASTFSMTSFGKRMVLFVVGGIDGILNLSINIPLFFSIFYRVSIFLSMAR